MMAPGDHLIVFPTRTPLSESAGSITIPCSTIQRTVSNDRPIRISDSSGSLRPSVTRSRSARNRFAG
jgi:hypothetical protein